jgi:putative MFS transporter
VPPPGRPGAETDGAAPARNPWYLTPFFGREPALPRALRSLIGLVSLGTAFEQYDVGLLNAALPQIAHDLAIAPADTGYLLGAIRLGGIGTVLLLPFADRAGRRRLFLLSMVGMSVGECATGFAPTALVFCVFQLLTRIFMLAVFALAIVILVEELPADRRGAGLGLLTVLAGMGYGLAAGLYAAVDLIPGGWRSLYAMGIGPALLLPMFRRRLLETRRFAQQVGGHAEPARAGLRAWAGPLVELMRERPGRAAAVGLAAGLGAVGSVSFFQYTSLFVQDAHAWAPGQYSLLVLGGGLIGITGGVFGGRLSDHVGRRAIGFGALLFAPAGVALFYQGPAATLVPAWGLAVFSFSAGDVMVRAVAGELFGTSHRSTSLGWLMLLQTLGWTLGLVLVGALTQLLGDLPRAVTLASFACVVAGMCLLALPDSHRRELEAI